MFVLSSVILLPDTQWVLGDI